MSGTAYGTGHVAAQHHARKGGPGGPPLALWSSGRMIEAPTSPPAPASTVDEARARRRRAPMDHRPPACKWPARQSLYVRARCFPGRTQGGRPRLPCGCRGAAPIRGSPINGRLAERPLSRPFPPILAGMGCSSRGAAGIAKGLRPEPFFSCAQGPPPTAKGRLLPTSAEAPSLPWSERNPGIGPTAAARTVSPTLAEPARHRAQLRRRSAGADAPGPDHRAVQQTRPARRPPRESTRSRRNTGTAPFRVPPSTSSSRCAGQWRQ